MEKLITNFLSEKRHARVAITVIFTITVLLSRNFECNCKSKAPDCGIYMTLPWAMIFVLMLWTNSSFQRISRYTCDGKCAFKCPRFCVSFIRHIVKSLLVSALWPAYLLFGGSWYICCKIHDSNSTEDAQLPCKDKWKLTPEERELITELNNESRRYGYILLLLVISAGALMSLPNWRKCCKKISNRFDRKNRYYRVILEEEGMVQKEVLRNKVKEKMTDILKKMIDNEQWGRFLNAAEELIESETVSSFELEEPGATQFQDVRSSESERFLEIRED